MRKFALATVTAFALLAPTGSASAKVHCRSFNTHHYHLGISGLTGVHTSCSKAHRVAEGMSDQLFEDIAAGDSMTQPFYWNRWTAHWTQRPGHEDPILHVTARSVFWGYEATVIFNLND